MHTNMDISASLLSSLRNKRDANLVYDRNDEEKMAIWNKNCLGKPKYVNLGITNLKDGEYMNENCVITENEFGDSRKNFANNVETAGDSEDNKTIEILLIILIIVVLILLCIFCFRKFRNRNNNRHEDY